MTSAANKLEVGCAIRGAAGQVALVISLFSVLSGCAIVAPRLQLEHVTLAKDRIFVETITYADVLEYHATHRTLDLRHYLISYPLKTAISPGSAVLSRVSFQNDLLAAYSSTRMFRLSQYEVGSMPIFGQLIEVDSHGSWRVLRDWKWPRLGVEPPIAVDSLGHYLIELRHGITVLDTSNLRAVSDAKLTQSFDVASRLDPGAESLYYLTQNLNYLVVRLAERDSSGSDRFQASDGRSYLRGPDRPFGPSFYYAVIDRRTAKIRAIPDRTPANNWRGLRSTFVGAGESQNGALLLLYGEYPPTAKGIKYTVRDEKLMVLHEVVVPVEELSQGQTAGPDVAWNPAIHSVLFYDHRDLARNKAPVTMHIWDYETGTLRPVSIDISAAFRREGNAYAPR